MRLLDKYDLFIFDWDNTLASPSALMNLTRYTKPRYWSISRARKRAVAEQGKGMGRLELESLEEEHRLLSFVYDLYLKLQKPRLKPKAAEVLEYLKLNGKKVAIFSDGRSGRLMKEIHLFGLSKYLDFAAGANAFRRYKPDPTGLVYIADKFRTSKKRSVYVCDMTIDVITARLAGMDSCAISDGLSSAEALERERPTYLFADLAEFLHALSGKRRQPRSRIYEAYQKQ
ncbi:MAG: HAD family hydrolase [Candidatus Micrarchaeia archaeon]